MSSPCRNPAVFFCPGEQGYLAYAPDADQLHRLNPLASLIADLCDGERGLTDIERLVEPMLPDGAADAVRDCVEQGLRCGLFLDGAAAVAAPIPDPGELVRGLRAESKFEAAYICQYSAAERDAENPVHWAALGELAHILGRRDDARAAYERYLALAPDDAEIRHLLIALCGELPPPRMSDEAVGQLYERFAGFYESNMFDELDYQGPRRIAALVADLMPGRDGLKALDLGCGSGLAGVELRHRCARLVGVDLSPAMLDLARARALYDELAIGEMSTWLAGCADGFDLIVACDSLVYFGDLRPIVQGSARLLTSGGLFVFSLERGDRMPYRLSDNGRYTHHPDAVREMAQAAGLEIARIEEDFLRLEYGEPVIGLFTALRKV